jgi:ribosomal-protein-alanine N-acetyltransferase
MTRELTSADEPALTAFFAANNRADIVRNFHPFPLDAASATRLCREPRKDRYFIFEESGAVFGLAMLRGWDEGFAVPSFGILVHHAHHGKGIGRALTEHALAVAGEMRVPRVRLTVRADNARAVHLYESMGFHTSETLSDGRLVMFAEIR